jgi:ParB family chromosome partitioning protein
MGRRTSLASLAGGKIEDIPGHSAPTLVRLRVSQIAATPLNPRQNFGSPQDLSDLGESMRVRQLQPVVAVSRTAYLKLWPDHEERIGAADYVLANGERRYRAAIHVGLDALDVLIREEVGDSRASFLDAVLSENLDRKNFDPIEEAQAVETMVQECGTAKAAAAQFRRHETWVSQRRALLRLTPELQEGVRSGELPVRIARSIASLPPGDQAPAWRKTRAQQAEETQRRTAERRARSSGEDSAPSEMPDPQRGADPIDLPRLASTAEKDGRLPAIRAGDGALASSATQTSGPQAATDVIPWRSPEALAVLIREHVEPDGITTLIKLLSDSNTAGAVKA